MDEGRSLYENFRDSFSWLPDFQNENKINSVSEKSNLKNKILANKLRLNVLATEEDKLLDPALEIGFQTYTPNSVISAEISVAAHFEEPLTNLLSRSHTQVPLVEKRPPLRTITEQPCKIGLDYTNDLESVANDLTWEEYDDQIASRASRDGSDKYVRGAQGKKMFTPGGLISDLSLNKKSENLLVNRTPHEQDLMALEVLQNKTLEQNLRDSDPCFGSVRLFPEVLVSKSDESNVVPAEDPTNEPKMVEMTDAEVNSENEEVEAKDVFNYEISFDDNDSNTSSVGSQDLSAEENELDENLNPIVPKQPDVTESSQLEEKEEEKPVESRTFQEVAEDVEAVLQDNTFSTGELASALPSALGFSPLTAIRKSSKASKAADSQWALKCDLDANDFSSQIPIMAKSFPFELDAFQKKAVMRLERGEHVFVAAHTSAGKTVVAEYAIALALKRSTRVVYTSPIKALSNQKYRDFRRTFPVSAQFSSTPEFEATQSNVGLITGDVSLNPEAACLVMTTEILRSMLYRGADLVRDIEWVVFDEVHYVNDLERGVVWEEVIIMLPEHVNMIFLSATTPNTLEFSAWIGRTKQKKVYVIQTDKRPVPLEHFIFAGKKMHKILDKNNKFLSKGVDDARTALMSPKERKLVEQKKNKQVPKGKDLHKNKYGAKSNSGGGRFASNGKQKNQYFMSLVKDLLLKSNLVPCVVFTFSKKRCDERAGALKSVDMTNSGEKSRIHVVFAKALKRLSEIDRDLPQIKRMKELVSRGIGVHHGGLLPILKEVVEILFSSGLIKLLFATETFAIGVNMPAKSVVFNGLRKHDGISFRNLLPGEYIQMSGRAGRRGIDAIGTVLIASESADSMLDTKDLQQMLVGRPTKLESKFKLSYSLILKILKLSEMSVEEMIKMSFSEYEKQKNLGGGEALSKLALAEKKLAEMGKALQAEYVDTFKEIDDDSVDFDLVSIFLDTIERVKISLADCFKEVKGLNKILGRNSLVLVVKMEKKRIHFMKLCRVIEKLQDGSFSVQITSRGKFKTMTINADEMLLVSSVKANRPQKLAELEKSMSLQDLLASRIDIQTLKQFSKLDLEAGTLWQDYKSRIDNMRLFFFPQITKFIILKKSEFQRFLRKHQRMKDLERKLRKFRALFGDESLQLFPDFQARLHVLRYLTYIDRVDDTVLLKGRTCTEIATCHELILCETVFQNVFADLDCAEIAALLSAFIVKHKNNDEPILNPRLEKAKRRITEIGSRLENIQRSSQVQLEDDWLERNLNFGLMEVVYNWATGLPFREICKTTSVDEGLIVRSITRLDETIREVRNIAQIIGDPVLFKKMEEASNAIKRDIIFASSLYVT